MTDYADLADFYVYGLTLVQCGPVSVGVVQSCIDARNEYADTKMRARYKLPLLAPFPADLKMHVCHLAAWDVWLIRGANPGAGADVNIPTRGELALRWFDDVERQRAHPNVVESGSEDPGYAAPRIISKPKQGWV